MLDSDNGDFMQDLENFDFEAAFTAAEVHEQNLLDFTDMPPINFDNYKESQE